MAEARARPSTPAKAPLLARGSRPFRAKGDGLAAPVVIFLVWLFLRSVRDTLFAAMASHRMRTRWACGVKKFGHPCPYSLDHAPRAAKLTAGGR